MLAKVPARSHCSAFRRHCSARSRLPISRKPAVCVAQAHSTSRRRGEWARRFLSQCLKSGPPPPSVSQRQAYAARRGPPRAASGESTFIGAEATPSVGRGNAPKARYSRSDVSIASGGFCGHQMDSQTKGRFRDGRWGISEPCGDPSTDRGGLASAFYRDRNRHRKTLVKSGSGKVESWRKHRRLSANRCDRENHGKLPCGTNHSYAAL